VDPAFLGVDALRRLVRLAGVNMRGWKALLVLSILVPVGLFAGFKLTGVISGPPTVAETVHLQPAVWTRERPYMWCYVPGDEWLNTSYADGEITFSVRLVLVSYSDDWLDCGPALVGFGISSLNASVPSGFIESVQVDYKETYPESWAYIRQFAVTYGNLTTYSTADGYSNYQMLENESKACLKALALGQPREVYMGEQCVDYWLHSPYNYTHRITIEVAVTYFNGTVYKQLVQPVELVFGPDHNNSFEEAEEIGFGTHRDYADDTVEGDPVDYFKIYFQEGQKVNISVLMQRGNELYPPPGGKPYFFPHDTFVYDPKGNIEACLLYKQNTTYQMVLSINATGWWQIKVTGELPYLYALDVSLIQG